MNDDREEGRGAANAYWGGSRSVQRGTEKELETLRWLYFWDFSSRSLLAQRLGYANERGQGAFFKRLAQKGLIAELPTIVVRHGLYQLTPDGRAIAAAHWHQGDLVAPRARLSPAMQLHDLTAQQFVIRHGGPFSDFVTERYLLDGGRHKAPDVILTYPTERVAIEVELSHKNTARLYYGFWQHLTNIRDGLYSRVRYVFTNAALCENYRKKCLAPEWPVYFFSQARQLKRQGGAPKAVPPVLQQCFSFDVTEVYR